MILHCDDHWLAVDKPTGLATHAPRPGELGAAEWLELHLGIATHVVSRLDRGTSGVLLLARDPAAAARAERIHADGGALKVYEFLSDRAAPAGTPDAWERDDAIDGRPARTVFRKLGPVGTAFGFRAEIARGRTHQVRRHAAASGVPILGDDEHGGAPWPRLCLHCLEVRWPEIARPVRAERPPTFRALADDPSGLGLALCRDRRGRWPATVSDAWRVVHRGEIAGLPASVEVYGDWLDATWYGEDASAAEVARTLDPLLAGVAAQAGCRGGTVRVHRRNPHGAGAALVADLAVVGEAPPGRFAVTEHASRYEVSLTGTQHTGLFLDQRDTRRRVAAIASGRRVANLFAYTCSFSVAAVAAGAEVTFSVDVAKPGLMTGRANFELNGLTEGGRGKFIQEDARRWLRRQLRKREADPGMFRPLDLLICDPPVFGASRDGGRFSLEEEWPRLARAAADLLGPEGVAVFANNHRGGDHARYREQLAACFGEVVDLRAPLDFPEPAGTPPHVRTFWCTMPAPSIRQAVRGGTR